MAGKSNEIKRAMMPRTKRSSTSEKPLWSKWRFILDRIERMWYLVNTSSSRPSSSRPSSRFSPCGYGKDDLVRLSKISPLAFLGLTSVVASATCWKLLTPQPGYVPHVESTPCTAGAANGCGSYLVCQPGSQCKSTFNGVEYCNQFMANRPAMMYAGGSISSSTGCCIGTPASYVGLHPTATCPTPLGIATGSGCLIAQPNPQ